MNTPSNQAAAPALTACHRVLKTVELLEMTLLELPTRKVAAVKSVNKTFDNTITGSKALQRRFIYQHEPSEGTIQLNDAFLVRLAGCFHFTLPHDFPDFTIIHHRNRPSALLSSETPHSFCAGKGDLGTLRDMLFATEPIHIHVALENRKIRPNDWIEAKMRLWNPTVGEAFDAIKGLVTIAQYWEQGKKEFAFGNRETTCLCEEHEVSKKCWEHWRWRRFFGEKVISIIEGGFSVEGSDWSIRTV